MAYVIRARGAVAGGAGPLASLVCRSPIRMTVRPRPPSGTQSQCHLSLPSASIDWMATPEPVPYEAACAFMARRVEAIAAGAAGEVVWLLEHPPLYTAGTSAKREHLIEPDRLPVFRSPRGGQFTYHGPGQRVVYLMLDVQARFGDVRAYVAALEQWIIAVLAEFGVAPQRRAGLIGVWVRAPEICPPSSPKSPPLACACDAGSARTA